MPVQDRPTEYLIKTGNYFKDAVDNICEFLKREQRDDPDQELTYIRRVINIYDNDLLKIPETPCICVAFMEHDEEISTIGKTNVTDRINIGIDIWYYHAELNEEIRKDEIRDALWEICRIVRRNADLNGLSPLGAIIRSSEVSDRIRVGNIYTGGRIRVNIPILIQTRRAIS